MLQAVEGWGLLTLLWMTPLLGLLFLAIGRRAKLHRVTAVAMGLPLGLTVFLCFLYPGGDGWFLESRTFWCSLPLVKESLPLAYQVALDGVSLPFLLLTALLFPLAALASRRLRHASYGYYALLLLLQACTLGAFVATNALLFFLFLEGTLLCMFFLVGRFGAFARERAATTYLLMGGFGSLLLLFGLLALLFLCQSLDAARLVEGMMNLQSQVSVNPEAAATVQKWTDLLFGLLVLGFALKLPIVPFHTWMVRTHVEAPLPVAMVHAGILLKLGAYGIFRFIAPVFPEAMQRYGTWFVILGLVNLLYGAFLAWRAQEGRKVLAYASLSHMGIILIGLGLMKELPLQGALYQMVAHGLTAALAFFLLLLLEERLKTTRLDAWSGLGASLPRLAVWMRFAGLALLGLPGLAGFVGETFVFTGVMQAYSAWFALPLLLGFFLAAVYALRLAIRPTFGVPAALPNKGLDIRWHEKIVLASLGGLLLLLGLWPALLLDWFEPAVQTLLTSRRGIPG